MCINKWLAERMGGWSIGRKKELTNDGGRGSKEVDLYI